MVISGAAGDEIVVCSKALGIAAVTALVVVITLGVVAAK